MTFIEIVVGRADVLRCIYSLSILYLPDPSPNFRRTVNKWHLTSSSSDDNYTYNRAVYVYVNQYCVLMAVQSMTIIYNYNSYWRIKAIRHRAFYGLNKIGELETPGVTIFP